MSSSSTTNKTNCSRGSSARSRRSARVIAQTPVDAKLHVEFEESEQQFDYSSSVNLSNSTSNVPSSTVSDYLQKMQRGSLIQPFGCMIAIDEQNFAVIAYSENAPEMLDLTPHAVPSIEQQEALTFGTDVRKLFRSSGASALEKAVSFGELSLLNPILVHCKNSGKPFYAILHRIEVGLVIDLEPVDPDEVPVTTAGAIKSYKLAAKAIRKLQSLPSGDISLLCDVLVREVSHLTGYDRVMVYKFHEDEHGEVVAECRTPELEPYLGLHYPATDIPQASRFLFMKNKVRMICDCLAPPIRVIQDPRLAQSLSLGGSTLRAPHGCHAQYMTNMGTVASMAMSVMINEQDDELDSDQQVGRKLWGLVVCHHTCPRFLSFPLRYASEFLLQVFSVQVNKEVEMAAQLKEKQILQIQTVLCDMLLRDAPMGIVTQSPNVMDLVKCDGAALYYRNKLWLQGVTPAESQIRDIAEWLNESHGDSTGLNTDSLMEAGFPGASVLGDAVCGMAAVKITSKDFLFWFRSHTAKEIKWGGAKHLPGDKDDGRKMHPRSSFKAFLEVVKRRSLPWEDVEMDAIHSLQLILRGSLQDEAADCSKMIVNVPAVDTIIDRVDTLRINDMVRLVETASMPVLAVDTSGRINGWNSKVSELTGLPVENVIGVPLVDLVIDGTTNTIKRVLSLALQGKEEKNVEIKLRTLGPQEKGRCVEWNDAMHKLTGSKREEVIDQMLLGEVFTVNSFGCRVKDQDTLTQLTILLNRVIAGGEGEKFFFGLFNKQDKYIEALISANKKVDDDGRVTGVLCFLHVPSPELQYAMHVQKLSEQAAKNSLKKLTYVRLELKNPLNGINCIQNLLKSSDLSKDQRQLLKTSTMCQEQLAKIIDDTDIESIEECYTEMNSCEFNLGEVVTVVINQVMILSQERKVQVTWDSPVEVSQLYLIGDNLRLQQVLSDFLTTAILFTPFEDSSVHFRVIPRKERIGTKMYIMHLEFRITHPSPGIPDDLIQHMFHYSRSISREGFGLYISQKLVKIMDGTVQYLREADRSSFIILVEFPLMEKKNN
ncbi:phytochrome C isoform X3 [Solanum pennellii]|uniref:Phytochrome C isoform X3 n=1 Tax=Solanum pennellii TaxID=28526 RepID=A0ABM1H9K1_SOLPN|nr:phytochrome C isoform X3 [Solanum pennellii]